MTTARGKYFEDFSVGEVYVTGSRTITTTDIVNFACLSGDFNEVHANWEYCKTTPFGEPVAHGPLVYGIAAGLVYASGINEGTLIALLQIDNWVMAAPVRNGDTIRMEQEVVATRPASSGQAGIVTFERRILNHADTVVQRMTGTYLYRMNESASGAPLREP